MRYQIGGTLAPSDPTYVERKADRDLYDALKKGDFCYILNSRQIGKSSLMVKTKYRLQQEGYCCTTIDMTNIGTENITPVEWYKGIVGDLWSGLNLFDRVKLSVWWQEHEDNSPLQKLSLFVSEVLLDKCPEDNFCIFIDEIDSVQQLSFSVDDFFTWIRYCYNQRASEPKYNRLSFAIFGVASACDLIRDKQRTPFNIGRPVLLNGFSLEEAKPLAAGLNLPKAESLYILQQVLNWTGGQPFLTQKLCRLLLSICFESLTKDCVNTVVRTHILDRWEAQDEPEHLRTVRDRILADTTFKGRLLGIYQRVLSGEIVSPDQSLEHTELLLSGLVVKDGERLKVKNPIYRSIFNEDWVAKELNNLRPYASQIDAWLASKQQDSERLLQGLALKQALAWADDKQLSDLDHRFLKASQTKEKWLIEQSFNLERQKREQAQFALKAAKDANLLLSQAQRQSQQQARKLRGHPSAIAWLGGGFALLILLVRLTGLFQGAEWMVGDLFRRLDRTKGIVSNRITLITTDERDSQNLGEFPFSDRQISQALAKLNAERPKVIGLNLYRNFSLKTRDLGWQQFYTSAPNLIATEEVMGYKIVPPKSRLEIPESIGFSDWILDGDGKVRRALLAKDSPPNKQLSFPLKLSASYLDLDEKAIADSIVNDGFNLKQAKIKFFRGNDANYIRAEDDGYQILINYLGTQQQFTSYSLSQLLAGEVPADKIRDRLILIGSTANSFNKQYQTPYSNQWSNAPKEMAGIIIDANIVNQLLAAALDGQPMLKTWSEAKEWLWIIFWSLFGAALGYWLQSIWKIIVGGVISVVLLVSISYLAFMAGWLLPLFPCLLGLALSSKTYPLVAARQLKKEHLRHTVRQIVTASTTQPAVIEVALENFKQQESDDNRVYIDRLVREITRESE